MLNDYDCLLPSSIFSNKDDSVVGITELKAFSNFIEVGEGEMVINKNKILAMQKNGNDFELFVDKMCKINISENDYNRLKKELLGE